KKSANSKNHTQSNQDTGHSDKISKPRRNL
ncbi:hypothetical protein CP02DC14_0615B, partial [Chlamydia psittaci 02DC14]